MSGNNLLLDTNIILYFLKGDDTLVPLMQESELVISIITEMELLGYGPLRGKELSRTKEFLDLCTIINITTDIKERAIKIRRNSKIKLPDAVIIATAASLDIPLITADRDFEKAQIENLIIYKK
jgi:predicted nucleic acid-binding protein